MRTVSCRIESRDVRDACQSPGSEPGFLEANHGDGSATFTNLMKCKSCQSSFAQHDLVNELCLRCTAKELAAALERERVLREALNAMAVRAHSNYDWNADPNGITLMVGNALAATGKETK